MAEPQNTPMPGNTPVTGMTPRSASPVGMAAAAVDKMVLNGHATSATATATATVAASHHLGAPKPIVLHIGDPVRYNPTTYASFSEAFDVVRPDASERQRDAFAQALRERRWGDFAAIFRPFWGSGGEMGRWDAELIALLPDSCRVFASAGAGFDWADTKALGEKGIIYCNSGLAAAEAVADFAVAMVLSTFRHLPWCMGAATATSAIATVSGTAESLFEHCHASATAASHNLRSHALGIVGLGNIGQQLALKLGCPAFGMEIHYHDVLRKDRDAVERGLGATFHPTLESLLAASDCVVLCAPPVADGRPLIDGPALAALKPGARLVNVARGSLVDEEALADALESGAVAAAALDVHRSEPRVNPRLLAMAGVGVGAGDPARRPVGTFPGRVMLTCHNAGGTVETHVGFEELSMRNIMAVLGGGEAITPVNLRYLNRG